MDWQPGEEDGDGAASDRDPGLPSSAAGGQPPGPAPSGGARSARDPRLAIFAEGDSRPAPVPSGWLALLADELSGPDRRCPGATDDELIGLLRTWAAIESWAAGAKLGVIREVMRREAPPSPGADHGDLPEVWSASLRYELAGALACSTQSAEVTAALAWEQGARLPGIGACLDDGTLTAAKARVVTETFRELTDPDAARAEALVLDQLAGKTFMQVLRLAEQASLTVDPGLAERRRERAVKRDARVSLFREQAGTAGLSGRDLPPDEALAAKECVDARAEEYRDCGAFDGTPMDVLRACAYLDLINGVPAGDRIKVAAPPDDDPGIDDYRRGDPGPDHPGPDHPGPDHPGPHNSGPGDGNDPGDGGGPGGDGGHEDGASAPGDDDGHDNGASAPGDDDGHDNGASAPGGDDGHDNGASAPGDDDGHDNGASGPGGDDGRDNGASGPGGDDGHDNGASGPGGDDGHDNGASAPGDDDGHDNGAGLDGTGPGGSDDGTDDDDHSDEGGGGGSGPGDSCGGGPDHRSGPLPTGQPRQRRPADLTVPLLTLLGLARRPGEIHGFGLLDPSLSRQLAAAAAASPDTEICLTVTSPEGYAIGHGCAHPPRQSPQPEPAGSLVAMPARLNLTIPAAALPGPAGLRGPTGLVADHDLHRWVGAWSFTTGGSPPAPGGFGSWEIAIPGGRTFTVRLDPVPTLECDHRYESHRYQPGARLRHLVQIRDGTCTFPPCNRHARESDFEHAVPFDQGGRTCACNAGARSRACHRVKQSPGWNVTQPRPGWHQWITPAGRTYVQEPKRYPA
ncbi:MAG TPA: DUF222 domain-containing protein [Trebonia sp.]|nr:DUF222 domain-containing protein [Trebonia sp.]